MMRFSSPQVEQLKHDAKQRRRVDSSLTHSQALDLVAAEQGWKTWSLLVNHSLANVSDALNLDCREPPGWAPGVFMVSMTIVDEDIRDAVLRERQPFSLPQQKGWLFRGAGPRQHEFGPYIAMSAMPPNGVFVEAYWQAILSVNGIQAADVEDHVRGTLQDVLEALRLAALEALLPQVARISPTAGGRVRLFVTKPGPGGLPQLGERSYDTVAEAKAAILPDGWTKVGVARADGSWLTYQIPFGWSDDARD